MNNNRDIKPGFQERSPFQQARPSNSNFGMGRNNNIQGGFQERRNDFRQRTFNKNSNPQSGFQEKGIFRNPSSTNSEFGMRNSYNSPYGLKQSVKYKNSIPNSGFYQGNTLKSDFGMGRNNNRNIKPGFQEKRNNFRESGFKEKDIFRKPFKLPSPGSSKFGMINNFISTPPQKSNYVLGGNKRKLNKLKINKNLKINGMIFIMGILVKPLLTKLFTKRK